MVAKVNKSTSASKPAIDPAATVVNDAQSSGGESEGAQLIAPDASAANTPAADTAIIDKPKETKAKIKALSISAKVAGFRRGGRAWGGEATVVPVSEFTAVQLEQIKGESMLAVVEVEIDAPADE